MINYRLLVIELARDLLLQLARAGCAPTRNVEESLIAAEKFIMKAYNLKEIPK